MRESAARPVPECGHLDLAFDRAENPTGGEDGVLVVHVCCRTCGCSGSAAVLGRDVQWCDDRENSRGSGAGV